MRFTELHDTIPYVKGGKEKVLRYSPYPNITLAMPGRHALDTVPVGGDFVVMVNDPIYTRPDHQFTHTDIFKDVEVKRDGDQTVKSGVFVGQSALEKFMLSYLNVIADGTSPEKLTLPHESWVLPGIKPVTFFQAVQCLSVAEHRRYAKYESQFGGRYLPFRFAAGIAEGLWTAADAANLQRKGRPGVEMLERSNGTPILTKELMN